MPSSATIHPETVWPFVDSVAAGTSRLPPERALGGTAAQARILKRLRRMPQPIIAAYVLALAGGLAGCGTYATETWLKAPEAPSGERRRRVELYASAPPARPHQDVALIEVEQTHGLNDRGTPLMISRLLEKAQALGCDAVFVSGIRERASEGPNSALSLLDPGATTLAGVCMMYPLDETVRPFGKAGPDGSGIPPARVAIGARQRRDAEDPR